MRAESDLRAWARCLTSLLRVLACALSDVTPGGAAELGGLRAGDILLNYNEQAMTDLQVYSNLLRESAPGDTVRLDIQRGDQRLTAEAVLQAR